MAIASNKGSSPGIFSILFPFILFLRLISYWTK
jgi:hypothetical protein